MAYDLEQWKRRLAERSDLSASIAHLTRPGKIDGVDHDSVDILIRILRDGKIKGSTTESGFICGDTPAVCFQDAPVPSLAQNIWYESKYREVNKGAKLRYTSSGLLFMKSYAFRKGARPVVYDRTCDAKQYLPANQWWRIVNFDLNDNNSFIDWTHEREWRCPNEFEFEPDTPIVVVGGKDSYRHFIERCRAIQGRDIIREIGGIMVMAPLLF